MDALGNFFDVNHELVLFGYGLVFFVMGLVIALQSRTRSRLTLARSLGWLSLFGLSHGFHEWGLLFIPFQTTYLNSTSLSIMQVFQTLLLGISFAALFQFGADLLRERWPWLVWVAPVLLAGWLVYLLLLAMPEGIGTGIWQLQASIWARYVLCLPGALLSAYGLRFQATRQILPLGLSSIYSTLRVAGVAFLFYGFFAGLVTPEGSFFPADTLNLSLFVRWLGIPVPFFRSLAGLAMAVTIIRAMEVFDLEVDQLIEEMEIEQSLLAERDRIGRELHDGAIQMVYSAGLILQSAKNKVDNGSIVGERIDRAINVLNEAIAGLRAYMSDLRDSPSTLSLIDGLSQQTSDPRLTTLLEVEFRHDVPEAAAMNPVRTAHVLAINNEALANVIRHSRAQHAVVELSNEPGKLRLTIRDDGKGFDQSNGKNGYGLRNMRDRARLLGGELNIDSQPGSGTTVVLTAPWEES